MKLFGRQIPLFGGNDDDRRRERPRAAASRPRTQRSAFDLRGRLVLVCGTVRGTYMLLSALSCFRPSPTTGSAAGRRAAFVAVGANDSSF